MTSNKKGRNWVTCNASSTVSSLITLPPAICQKELVITFVESPCTFWGTLASQLGKQIDIENKLSGLCNSLARAKNVKPGKMYACKYSYDGLWYRCRMYRTINKNQVEVLYVDYGNREVVPTNSMVELPPDIADLHVLAYPYWLLRLKNVESSSANKKGMEIMEEIKSSTNLNSTLYSKTSEGVIPVTVVMDTGDDLAEMLVERGICSFMSDDEMKAKFSSSVMDMSLKRGIYRAEKAKSVISAGGASHPSSAGGASTAYHRDRMANSMKTSRIATSSPIVDTSSMSPSATNIIKVMPRTQSRSPVKLLKLKSMSVRDDGQMDYITRNAKGEEGDGQLTSNMQHNKKHIEYGIEQLSCELTESTNDVLCLQLENINLRREVEESREQVKIFEDIIAKKDSQASSKIKNMLLEAKKVNRLRKRLQKQNELKYELDKVGDLLMSVQPSNPMMRKIGSVQAVFDNLQRKIASKKAIDDELAKLISARDSARKLLHDDLQEFLDKISQYPLEESYETIKEILLVLSIKPEKLMELERNGIGGEGDDSSSCTDLPEEKFQSALMTYRAWRMSGLKDHRFIHIKMDDKKQQITLALSYVIKVMNEDDGGALKEDAALTSLDNIIDEFKEAAKEESLCMAKELGDVDAIPEGQEAGHGEGNSNIKEGGILWQSIEGLLLEVKKVIEVVSKYRSLLQELKTWLHRMPDVTDLKSIIRSIRCYKSQLRHLLADHADLEEEKLTKGCLTDSEHRIGLTNKLNHTRNVLQERLELENQILVRMLESDLKQFPELILYHLDIPFKNILSFGPIVKHGRSLDQYTLESFEDELNTHKSTYLGKPVILKECHLKGMSCEHFESFANHYVSSYDDPLAPSIDFLFFDMKKLTAIVQSSYRELTLGKMLGMGTDEKMLLYVLFNVLTCLNDMHKRGIIHGCINPSYIFYDSDTWTAFLRPPDFSFAPNERAKENMWRTWRYVAPELYQGVNPITSSVDMYSFGVLLYQICKPNSPLEQYADISTIFGKETPSCRLEMIKLLLSAKPEERPSAETLLKTQYWLDISRDYAKGKVYLLKQQPIQETQKPMMSTMPMSEMSRMEKKCFDKNKLRQKIVELDYSGDAYNDDEDSEDDSNDPSDDEQRFVEKKRSSKVKFAMEGNEYDKSGGDDDDAVAMHVLNDASKDKRFRERSRSSTTVRSKVKHSKGSVTGDDDYLSSDINTDGSGSGRQEDSKFMESHSDVSTVSGEGEDTTLSFTKVMPSLEQRISGTNRQLQTSKRNKNAYGEGDV